MEITAPVIVSVDPDCRFYRRAADVAASGIPSGATIFDSCGHRLEPVDGELRVLPNNPDGADELADVLRCWQGYIDALRESTMNWSLELLVRASLDFSEFETD
jgi:hypothetical protein